MNTIRSTWIGWGTLIVAGGGAYYFAKRSVNADKKARHEEDTKRRKLKTALEAEFRSQQLSTKRDRRKPEEHTESPSIEASRDPAPIGHSMQDKETISGEANKYLASKPYRARKGDRFS